VRQVRSSSYESRRSSNGNIPFAEDVAVKTGSALMIALTIESISRWAHTQFLRRSQS